MRDTYIIEIKLIEPTTHSNVQIIARLMLATSTQHHRWCTRISYQTRVSQLREHAVPIFKLQSSAIGPRSLKVRDVYN